MVNFFESFGLPLLEASSIDLPIIASESDYVRDVCEPAQTFDPNSYLVYAPELCDVVKSADT